MVELDDEAEDAQNMEVQSASSMWVFCFKNKKRWHAWLNCIQELNCWEEECDLFGVEWMYAIFLNS